MQNEKRSNVLDLDGSVVDIAGAFTAATALGVIARVAVGIAARDPRPRPRPPDAGVRDFPPCLNADEASAGPGRCAAD